MMVRALIVALCAAGLGDAFYFTLAYYGRVRRANWVPAVLCAREDSNCVTVVQTRWARVFGVPNSLLGIFYYAGVMAWALGGPGLYLRLGAAGLPLRWLILAAGVVTVLLGSYLIYALLRKLHTHCPLCYLAHGINAGLLVLLFLFR
jgi:uncharacterized membrane protein